MVLSLYFLALASFRALAAPAISSPPQMVFDSLKNNTGAALNTQSIQQNASLRTSSPSLIPASLSNSGLTNATSSQLPHISTSPLSHNSFSLTPFASLPVPTIFVTDVVTMFETITIVPLSTSVVTIVIAATATTTVTVTPSKSWDHRTLWTAPPQMTDLSAFNVTHFPSGQRNLHIVAHLPAQDIVPTAKSLQTTAFPVSNTTAEPAILQLLYPAHSVNPGSKPEGGADFYATPLNLAGAHNVTLEYSVFFPVDFNWVKGGKLPGLFGGHTGCSGGASARDCFSTRLMWRPHGVGELYLYAPKDRQTTSLCEDLDSVCDVSYGLSIGRGAFNFTAGDWTRLQQTVVLNTPGRNDGVFRLLVDGVPAINRSDIFYRDVAKPGKNTPGSDASSSSTEFVGLFFSTFFGGHGKEYATPKQQYTWFKDFTIARHD